MDGDAMTEKPFIGIHVSMYTAREELIAAIRDVDRVALIALSGVDRISPLERLAITVLREAGHI
jgi:hypothetical protein